MKLGLALSGGGIRGIAHAGVLKALEENNIKIDIIGGISSGSMVAALYAMGYSPYSIYELCKKYSKQLLGESNNLFSGISKFMLSKKIEITGLKTGKSLETTYDVLAKQLGIQTISDIKMPLVISAVDIMTCKKYVFTNQIPPKKEYDYYITDISIGKAIRASSSFPAVFSPCHHNDYIFMDGGVLENVPVDEVKSQGADKVIAVKFQNSPIDKRSNVFDIVMRTVEIMGNKISEEELKRSDYLVDIITNKIDFLDSSKIDECFEFGYNAVKKNISEIKQILK